MCRSNATSGTSRYVSERTEPVWWIEALLTDRDFLLLASRMTACIVGIAPSSPFSFFCCSYVSYKAWIVAGRFGSAMPMSSDMITFNRRQR